MSSTADKRGQKRPCDDEDDGGGKRPASEVAQDEEEDKCWICHDTEIESDEPLSRDCSCRGSAGFAHLTCIAKYAKNKCKEQDFENHLGISWRKCPNCKRDYQHELARDLSKEFAAFVEKDCPGDKELYISSLDMKLSVAGSKEEKLTVANKILSTIDEMEMDDSAFVVRFYEAHTHLCIGFLQSRADDSNHTLALSHLEKARNIFHMLGSKHGGYKHGALAAESRIAELTMEEDEWTEKKLANSQQIYDFLVNQYGEESGTLIKSGKRLSVDLKCVHRGTEAERLIVKMLSISNRVNGRNHSDTLSVKETLRQIKFRGVQVESRGWDTFQALRYEEDGAKCVVRGPVIDTRSVEDKEIFTVSSKEVLMTKGTPVICNRLEGTLAHLNGKIGDVRSYDEEEDSYNIHFEDKNLQTCLVKWSNVRILFDLPTKG